MPTRLLSIVASVVDEISLADDKEKLHKALSVGLKKLGFSTYNFSTHKTNIDELVLNPTLSTWSGEFTAEYRRNGWNRKNPLLLRSIARRGGFVWDIASDSAFNWRSDDWPSRAFLDYRAFLGAMKMQSGIVASVSVGPVFSGISVESDGGERFSPAMVAAVSIIANAAVMRAEILGLADAALIDQGMTERILSQRQLEILKWAAEGKSNGDIATITGQSRRAVDYHMAEILRKLGVATRVQAISAMKLGPGK